MTSRTAKVYDRLGNLVRILHGDEHYILQDGETLRVFHGMMDAAPDNGIVFFDKQRDIETGQAAYEERISNAWRERPATAATATSFNDATDPTGQLRYEERQRNAWKTGGMV